MEYTLSNVDMLKAQCRIIVALMLHDIRSRFGGSALGFVAMAIGWPLMHILGCLVIYSFIGRAAPYTKSLKALPMGPLPRSDRHDEPRAFN